MNVLLLEDDPILSKETANFLATKNFQITTVFDGDSFLKALGKETFHIYLLDINVPQISGLEACRKIREKEATTPILMLTAYGDIADKMAAFGFGADDYLVKPFHFEELYLRITSLLKRSTTPQNGDESINIGDLRIYPLDKKAKRGNDWIDLTPKEYKLLMLLASAKGRPVTKQTIAEQVWDIQIGSNFNTIEVYINFLRKKIDKNYTAKLIHTRAGFGYFLKNLEAENN